MESYVSKGHWIWIINKKVIAKNVKKEDFEKIEENDKKQLIITKIFIFQPIGLKLCMNVWNDV